MKFERSKLYNIGLQICKFVAKNQFLYSTKSFRSVRSIIKTFDRTERNLDLIESYKTSIESEKKL